MSMLIKKWFNLLASDNSPSENLKAVLRPYEIVIDKRLYEVLDGLVLEFMNACYADPKTIEDPKATDPDKKFPYNEKNSPFCLDAAKLKSQAKTMLNMSIMDAIGDVWSQFGINIETAKSGPAVRKIKLCRAVVKERLMKRFEYIISDFYGTIQNLKDLRDGKIKDEDTSVVDDKTTEEKSEEISPTQEEGTHQ